MSKTFYFICLENKHIKVIYRITCYFIKLTDPCSTESLLMKIIIAYLNQIKH